jgi:carbonic anhydrase/acetyltransferase-like protein (isoleucine patch superfamily)
MKSESPQNLQNSQNSQKSSIAYSTPQPLIIPIHGIYPSIGDDCFIAPNATLVGDVKLGTQCSVWFNAVLRGDVGSITIGNQVNIQDGAVLHCTYKKANISIGHLVSIGHQAMVHGCTIGDNVLIGMGAIIMDGAIIESNSIVASGAVVLEGTVVESNSIYAGTPAKKVKQLEAEQFTRLVQTIGNNYIMYADWVKEGLKLIEQSKA